MPELLTSLLDYIDMNLEKDLTLESLSTKFYVDRFYMGRVFKKYIGNNIHEYILFKRISKAKQILSKAIASQIPANCVDLTIILTFENVQTNRWYLSRKI